MIINKVTELYRISTKHPYWAYGGVMFDRDNDEEVIHICSHRGAVLFTSEKEAQTELEKLKDNFPGEVDVMGLHVENVWKI